MDAEQGRKLISLGYKIRDAIWYLGVGICGLVLLTMYVLFSAR